MADFETKLRWLSERGNPVGSEELIERIEAELAGDPLVVVTKRREGTLMTKTQQPPTMRQPRRFWGPGLALAAFAVVLAVGGLYIAFIGDDADVVGQTTMPTPTTLIQKDYEGIGPGIYFIDTDGLPSTPAGATVIIQDHGWIGSREGVNFNGESGVTLHLHVFVEPFTPGCDLDWGTPLPPGSTATDLADGIAASGFTVLEAPAPVSAFGHDGYHVVVGLPEGCQFGGDPGFTHNDGPLAHISVDAGGVIEAWAFDIEGDIAMVEAIWLAGYEGNLTESGEEDLAEARAVIDSLVLTP